MILSENWFAQWIHHGMSVGHLTSFASFLFVLAILTQRTRTLLHRDPAAFEAALVDLGRNSESA